MNMIDLTPFLSQVTPSHGPHPKLHVWFPSYERLLNRTLHTYCTAEYTFYLTHDGTPGCQACNIEPAISCILDNVASYNNANMQSAQVLLGLLPSMLALAAPTTLEVGVLALRRPVLAALLAAGAPAANPLRVGEYRDPKELLQWRPDGLLITPSGPFWRTMIVATQYVLALASIVNVASIVWTLGERTVLAWSPNSVVFPGVWALLALGVHLFGAVAVFLRVRLIENEKGTEDNMWSRLKRWTRSEFELRSAQPSVKLEVRGDDSPWFPLMSWFAATCTLAHIIFGVFMFSGMLFIGFGDALKVVIRLMASVVLCRIVLVYALSGLRKESQH